MLLLPRGDEKMGGSGGRTVVVGVKMDSQSKELLTWALVKVAQPGDTVVALHVLDHNLIVDRQGQCSLLSLVKAFDSVLAVYDGFCNLRQVDLKLKICRGSSVRKILVREAKSYEAKKLIVGTTRNHHSILLSSSVAKYCSRKLSKDCAVLAVNNGKVVFRRESSSADDGYSGNEERRHGGLLDAIHRSISRNKRSKVLSESGNAGDLKYDLEKTVLKACSNTSSGVKKQNCLVCGSGSITPFSPCKQSIEESCDKDGGDDKSLAIVPVKKAEAPTSSITTLVRQLPEVKPGWPLLRRACQSDRGDSHRSFMRQISVVQWALRLPNRPPSSSTVSSSLKLNSDAQIENESCNDGQSLAIVPLGTEMSTASSSPDCNSKSLPKELEGLHEKHSASCRLFSYQDLLLATSNFLAENLIGKGGSSQVYKGCLADGKELAVKILKPSDDMVKEFALEIEIITTLHHKNIISLLGFCFENNNLLLVYDFLSRGSLEENLHGSKKDLSTFSWNERYKVAVGIAEALDYLHNGISQPVIHRDVKSSNILLSDDYEPQLSDFGLAKWAPTSSSHIICSDVSGTFGYLAPEYFMYGKVNDKVDVYAFGVVLLELLSGRRPISSNLPKGQESLVMWAKPILNGGKVSELLDPSLGDNYNNDEMERMVLAATLCIRRSPRTRPKMSLVFKLLQGDAEVIDWARLQVSSVEESDVLEDETCQRTNLRSHLNLALLDVEDDLLSMSSIEQSVSLEDYLQSRWSRSSSFD